MNKLIILAIITLAAPIANAQVYNCNGTFTDIPCGDSTKTYTPTNRISTVSPKSTAIYDYHYSSKPTTTATRVESLLATRATASTHVQGETEYEARKAEAYIESYRMLSKCEATSTGCSASDMLDALQVTIGYDLPPTAANPNPVKEKEWAYLESIKVMLRCEAYYGRCSETDIQVALDLTAEYE